MFINDLPNFIDLKYKIKISKSLDEYIAKKNNTMNKFDNFLAPTDDIFKRYDQRIVKRTHIESIDKFYLCIFTS